MSTPTTGALILATADTGFGDASTPGCPASSLVEIAGEMLVSRVVRAVRDSARVGPIVVIVDDEVPGAPFGADQQLPSQGDLATDIRCGLAVLGECAQVVLLPGDIPFATGAEVDAFLDAALAREIDMAYPMIPRRACETAFPDLRRTYFRLAEGELTGGSALLLRTATFLQDGDIIAEAVSLRREPWRLALMVDPLILFSYSAGRLSVEHIESAACSALGIDAATIVLDAPGLAADIQKPIDVRAARQRLQDGGA